MYKTRFLSAWKYTVGQNQPTRLDVIHEGQGHLIWHSTCGKDLAHGIRKFERNRLSVAVAAGVVVEFCERKDNHRRWIRIMANRETAKKMARCRLSTGADR
jgi:hypothetical protein